MCSSDLQRETETERHRDTERQRERETASIWSTGVPSASLLDQSAYRTAHESKRHRQIPDNCFTGIPEKVVQNVRGGEKTYTGLNTPPSCLLEESRNLWNVCRLSLSLNIGARYESETTFYTVFFPLSWFWESPSSCLSPLTMQYNTTLVIPSGRI